MQAISSSKAPQTHETSHFRKYFSINDVALRLTMVSCPPRSGYNENVYWHGPFYLWHRLGAAHFSISFICSTFSGSLVLWYCLSRHLGNLERGYFGTSSAGFWANIRHRHDSYDLSDLQSFYSRTTRTKALLYFRCCYWIEHLLYFPPHSFRSGLQIAFLSQSGRLELGKAFVVRPMHCKVSINISKEVCLKVLVIGSYQEVV